MALKNSARWRHRERGIEIVKSAFPDPRETVWKGAKVVLTAGDAVEEVRRESPIGLHILRRIFLRG